MLAPSSLLVAALLAAPSVNAFWRLPCANPVVTERGDSIVSPGAISGHVHSILGASNFNLQTTFEQLRASECTSCLVKQDMSNYWTPELYFQWANGSFTNVDLVGGGLIYYLPRFHSSDKTNVTAFPDGLRMLTGNPFKRSYDSSSEMAQAIGWNCLGANVAATRQPQLPAYNCPNGLRGEIRFPSCWNGKDLDSSDHFSHMAYPIGGESGPCPAGYPVRLVTLFYEIMWSVDPMNKYRMQAANPTQPFVLAMGDASGYGYHGDFFNGWDRAVLQEAIDTCTSDSGVIEYCTVFDLYDTGHSCRKTPDVDEVVSGTLTKLPGCNPVTGAGANAVPCTDSSTPGLLTGTAYTGSAPPVGVKVPGNSPTVLQSYTSSKGSLWTYQDCYSDLVPGRALTNGLSTVNKTVEACLEACQAKNYALCGVEYHGECWGGNTLASGSTAQGAGACGLTCNDNPLQYCGGTGGPTGATFELYKRSDAAVSSSVVVSGTTTSSVKPSTTASSVASTSTSKISFVLAPTSSSSSSLSTTSVKPSTTTSAGASSTGVPSTKLVTTGWTYQGCYADLVNNGRSLPNSLSSPGWTVQSCLAAAKTANLSVAGVTYGGECWGGNALSLNATKQLPTACDFKCNNDATHTCGGNRLLDVYYSTTSPQIKAPTMADMRTFNNWQYDACYSDLVNNVRSLGSSYQNSNYTIETCLNQCTKAKQSICGLSYYGECYGGNTMYASAGVIDNTKCSFPCKGNPLEICGGSDALSIWRVKPAVASTTAVSAAVNTANTRLTFAQRKAAMAKQKKRELRKRF
ncbi:hypothetical protein JCM8097_005823 [Rhodosporidiobolus ruineniae]